MDDSSLFLKILTSFRWDRHENPQKLVTTPSPNRLVTWGSGIFVHLLKAFTVFLSAFSSVVSSAFL